MSVDSRPPTPPIIAAIAGEFANHRVIPFVGAGVSAEHLQVDWDAIANKMKLLLGDGEDRDNTATASAFVAKFGRPSLCQLLRDHLHVSAFDPELSAAHIALMSLAGGTLYTTNQDNLIELCHA